MRKIFIFNPHFNHFTGGGEINDKNIRCHSGNRVKIVSIEDPSKTCINLADINITGWYTNRIGKVGIKEKIIRAILDIYFGLKFSKLFISLSKVERPEVVTVTLIMIFTMHIILSMCTVKIIWAIRGKNSNIVNSIVRMFNINRLYWGRSGTLNRIKNQSGEIIPGVSDIFFDKKLREGNHCNLIFIGRSDDNKGFNFLYQWLKTLDAEIAGLFDKVNVFGPFDECDRVAHEKIVYHGSVDQVEMINKIGANDIYISCSRYENFPLTLGEMYTLGLRCVVPDVEFIKK